jgi:hypothetical protein
VLGLAVLVVLVEGAKNIIEVSTTSDISSVLRQPRDESSRYQARGGKNGAPSGNGQWDTRNGVTSFGWDSRRPGGCGRCQPASEDYRGNGYDNLSPEWSQKDMKAWKPGKIVHFDQSSSINMYSTNYD